MADVKNQQIQFIADGKGGVYVSRLNKDGKLTIYYCKDGNCRREIY